MELTCATKQKEIAQVTRDCNSRGLYIYALLCYTCTYGRCLRDVLVSLLVLLFLACVATTNPVRRAVLQ